MPHELILDISGTPQRPLNVSFVSGSNGKARDASNLPRLDTVRIESIIHNEDCNRRTPSIRHLYYFHSRGEGDDPQGGLLTPARWTTSSDRRYRRKLKLPTEQEMAIASRHRDDRTAGAETTSATRSQMYDAIDIRAMALVMVC